MLSHLFVTFARCAAGCLLGRTSGAFLPEHRDMFFLNHSTGPRHGPAYTNNEVVLSSLEAIAKEVTQILEHYKDADPERARMHVENVLTNEKIFVFLESL